MKPLVIAMTKGRLEQQTIALFTACGYDMSFMADKQRRLIFTSPDQIFEVLLVKAPDVTTYVRHGVADLGVVGKDVLLEHPFGYHELLDLGIGRCRFAVASTPDYQPDDYKRKVIATKYPTVTANYFAQKGEDVAIIKIEGSVEIAPVLGLADAIVDIVETGTTLKENGLQIFEEICPISARLIANKSSLKRERERILPLVKRLEGTL